MKTHAKVPGQAKQTWGETFHQQCGQCIYELLIIQLALKDHLGEDKTPVQDFESRKTATFSIRANGVEGLQFTNTIKGAEYHGNLAILVLYSQLSPAIPALPHGIVGFIAKVVAQFCPKVTLTIWSERVSLNAGAVMGEED